MNCVRTAWFSMRDGHRSRNHTWVAVALGLGACASGSGSADLPSETSRLARDLRQHRLVLRGEVHDNRLSFITRLEKVA